jgi:hypothetical protein
VEVFCLTPVIVLSLLRGWCVVYVGDASVYYTCLREVPSSVPSVAATLTEYFRSYPPFVQANGEMVPRNVHRR